MSTVKNLRAVRDAFNVTIPVSVNATLNSTAYFTCSATADVLVFVVNGSIQADNQILIQRGFTQTIMSDSMGNLRADLEVIAYLENNHTTLICTSVSFDSGNLNSAAAHLLIQGTLASVGNLTAITSLNGSSVRLTWTPPYTLDNVPIIGYHINIINTTVNGTSITLTTTDPDPCTPINVSVTAVNGAGIGEPAYTSFYYETSYETDLSASSVFHIDLVTQKVKINPLKQFGYEENLFSFELYVTVIEYCIGQYPSFALVDILNSNNTVIQETLLSLQKVDNFTLKGNESIIIPANLRKFSVNVRLHNSAGVFLDRHFFQFSYEVTVNNINSHVQLPNCSLINITWEKSYISGPGFVNLPIQYKLEILRDEQTVLELIVSNTSYQFEDSSLFHHRYTYVITAFSELGEGDPNNETFTYQNQTIDGLTDNIQIKRYTETQVSLDLSIRVVSLCQNVGPLQIYLNIFCGDHKFQLPFSNAFPSIKETISNIPLPRHEHCHYNATIISNVSTTVTDLEVYNFSTFDVQSISVKYDDNLICIVCNLISSSEDVNGCYVEGTTSKKSWNVTLPRKDSDISTSIVQDCINEPPVGNYTVYAYDLNGAMPLKEQPAASTILNITSTSSSSFVSSPSASPTSSSSPPTKYLPIGLTIGLAVGISIVPVIVLLIIIVLGIYCCRKKKYVKIFSLNRDTSQTENPVTNTDTFKVISTDLSS